MLNVVKENDNNDNDGDDTDELNNESDDQLNISRIKYNKNISEGAAFYTRQCISIVSSVCISKIPINCNRLNLI